MKLPEPRFGATPAICLEEDAQRVEHLYREWVIDDTLIDVKTTKELRLQRRDFDQLVGYYCLYKIGGIKGLRHDVEIENVAIYFSRHAYLHVIPVREFAGQAGFPKFLRWFKDRAKQVTSK